MTILVNAPFSFMSYVLPDSTDDSLPSTILFMDVAVCSLKFFNASDTDEISMKSSESHDP